MTSRTVPQPLNGCSETRRRGRRQLVAAVATIAVVWLGLLPWLARRPSIDARLRWLESRRIDPSAMYYTDLEAMEPILRRLRQRERRGDSRTEL